MAPSVEPARQANAAPGRTCGAKTRHCGKCGAHLRGGGACEEIVNGIRCGGFQAPCRRRVARARPEGARCRLHGMVIQEMSPDDPRYPGAPARTGLYAKYLRGGMEMDYEDAKKQIGSLDDELQLARSYLAWAVKRHQENPTGAEAINVSKGADGKQTRMRVRFYHDIVAELTDRVRRLERTRAAIKLAVDDGDSRNALRALMDRIRGEVDASD